MYVVDVESKSIHYLQKTEEEKKYTVIIDNHSTLTIFFIAFVVRTLSISVGITLLTSAILHAN